MINYRAVFLRDQMYVDMKALTEVKILKLNLETLMALVAKHGEQQSRDRSEAAVRAQKERIQQFSTRVLIAQNRYLKAEKPFPVDYLKDDPKAKESNEDMGRTMRRNLLKNVVMRIVLEILERRNRPSLVEVMHIYRKKKDEPNAKEKFQEKFIKLYGNEEDLDEGEKDEKYKTLLETMTRIK